MNLQNGVRLGAYEIVAPLGSGGMGEVYRALDPRLGREVAIKILPAALFDDPVRRRRLEQEARAAGALSHPNLLTIFELGSHEGAPFIASELLEGETLRRKLRAGALSRQQALDYARQIASGLAAAHGRGIVHRDLKPENVFITDDGRVKILDFGLAKVDEPAAPQDADTDLLTAPGVVLGTLAYMPPEQVSQRPVDARADVFAFGAIVFEILTGRPAFQRASPAETIAAILDDDPLASAPHLPFASVVRRCLEKDPQRRFQSGREIVVALESAAAAPSMRWARLAIAMALLAAGLAAVWLWSIRARTPHIASLAVLPLRDLSGTTDRYFADGLTEEIITRLAQIRSLRVVPRSSVDRYAGSKKSLREIGQELNVDGVVTGSVLRSGDVVRVTAQLFDAKSERSLWADQYQRSLGDVLALQDDLALSIAGRIQVRMTAGDQQRLAAPRRIDPAAHDAYLKALYNFNLGDPEGFGRAVSLYEAAIERDPKYAAAHAGLAICYGTMAFYGILVPADAFPPAKEAALAALRLDPNLAEAHVALGMVLSEYEWNEAASETEYRRAIELDPSSEIARLWHVQPLIAQGRIAEALAEEQKVVELSPFGRVANESLPWAMYMAHHYADSIRQYRKALELNPDDTQLLQGLADAYAVAGNDAEAFAMYQQWARTAGYPAEVLADLDRAYRADGIRGYWRKQLELEEEETNQTGNAWPYRMAILHARLGDAEGTLSWLERGFNERNSHMIYARAEPVFQFLGGDRRFQNLLRRVGLLN